MIKYIINVHTIPPLHRYMYKMLQLPPILALIYAVHLALQHSSYMLAVQPSWLGDPQLHLQWLQLKQPQLQSLLVSMKSCLPHLHHFAPRTAGYMVTLGSALRHPQQ